MQKHVKKTKKDALISGENLLKYLKKKVKLMLTFNLYV